MPMRLASCLREHPSEEHQLKVWGKFLDLCYPRPFGKGVSSGDGSGPERRSRMPRIGVI
jgi:hypothetical protein